MSRKPASSKTFVCNCGHLAYWVNRRGWHCFCGNPRMLGKTRDNRNIVIEKRSPAKGPLVR